ncbi:MAG: hypothetical protein K6D02_10000 [Lachnospiraceae bacterium]|nr:hypothetical protein [Lachnospiraceae bacterium]
MLIFHKIFTKKVKAYMTVEASFIVPIIIGIIFSLIAATFYLHDRVIIFSYSENLANDFYAESSKNKDKRVNNSDIKDNISNKLWIMKISKCKYSSGILLRKISIEADYENSLNISKGFIKGFHIKEEKNILNMTPEESLYLKEKSGASDNKKDNDK